VLPFPTRHYLVLAGVGEFPMNARLYPPCRIFMHHHKM
jgi:hypothetical protein